MRLYRAITPFLLALLVIFSTTSFTTHMHFCGDELIKVGFYSQPDSCHSISDESSQCPMQGHDKGCCDNKSITFEGSDAAVNFISPDCPQPKFVDISSSLIFSFPSAFIDEKIETIDFNFDKPPNWRYLTNNYPIVFQHFII